MSYESMERKDTSLAQRTIAQADKYWVAVSSDISSSNMIHSVVDNYSDGVGHGTILMLFKNQSSTGQPINSYISQSEIHCQLRKPLKIMNYQKHVPRSKAKWREAIQRDYQIANDVPDMLKGAFADKHCKWLFLRYINFVIWTPSR